MSRLIARGILLSGLAALWLLNVSPAEAVPPPSPIVTTPASADFTVEVSAQPIHFEGTVPGPVGPNDRILVANFTANPGDPPLRCSILLSGATTWACDASPVEAVGDYELHVSWYAPDPPFGDISAPTVLTLHVIPDVVPPPPAPTPTETPKPRKKKPKPKHTDTPAPAPEPTLPPATVVPPVIATPAAPVPKAPQAPPADQPAPTAVAGPAGLGSWNPRDHPRTVLGIGIATFTMLGLIGPAGLALGASSTEIALAAAAASAVGGSKKGSVKSAKVKLSAFASEGSGGGDRSLTWRAPGWRLSDAWGTAAPLWLAPRSPLLARILADGGYLRAIFGSIWAFGALAGAGMGVIAAHESHGLPIPPALGLTAALLALAVFDATWGACAVVGFGVGVLLWHSDALPLAATIRSFMGLAALWFAIPLIAAASRPFRRPVAASPRYRWDRMGDAAIAALIGGWATQKTVGGLPGLSGLDLPIAHHANQLALLTIAAIFARIVLEELAAWRYPLRLDAAGLRSLPKPGNGQRLAATALRTLIFVFLAIAFIGPSWQLWVGAALFALPQVLSIYEKSFPNSERLKSLLPTGIVNVLVSLLIGTFFGRLVFAILKNPDSMLRNGFVLLALPGLALSLLGLFGHDGPDQKWTWPRQAAGTIVLLVTVWLVLTGW